LYDGNIMKAIILAAGQAMRLRPLTEFTQKCLLSVHGRPILEYQLAALKSVGITEIAIVTGHCAHKVREYISTHAPYVSIIENTEYLETNNAYSASLARSFVEDSEDGFLIVNSDIIFTSSVLKVLIDAPEKDAIVMERNPDFGNDMVKIEMDGYRIRAMSKTLPREKVSAQALGPVKLSQKGGMDYFDFINGKRNDWLFYSLGDYAKEHEFYGVENPGYPWAEADTPEDLEDAHRRISPELFNDLYGSR
jgi:L-glutamine-phosphate cytidylyltransferase